MPGVAFLRPGVADPLRTRIAERTSRRAPLTGNGTPGVRVGGGGGGGWRIDIRFVLCRGHRALDVTRAVQAAVVAALPEEPVVSVRITVTGVI
ncbi:Asp23/Gls24 family envelope stress response protein [Streptomyces sp. rh34]|uniref:Asp23/Gls24 family envelope stress response protein n=1 Tax=Streptomyces sp. rh34 TaxID=2034272 RepID=UPI00211D3B2E|nr:Asp23/Gls24 family envelope stress response protein [Streptomyces sp. rh34]